MKSFILVSSLIISVIFFFYFYEKQSNKYEISKGVYLKKIDYFSNYQIVKSRLNEDTVILKNVSEISSYKDGIVVKYKNNGNTIYSYYNFDNGLFSEIRELELNELIWKKPWHIVENKTLSNYKKMSLQLVLSILAILILFITMKVFKLKRLDFKK
jgi:hypothetical protein